MNIITKTLIGSAVAAGTVASAVLGVAVANAAEPMKQTKPAISDIQASTGGGGVAESVPAMPADELPAGETPEQGVDLGSHGGLAISGVSGTSAGDLTDAQPLGR